MLMLASSVAAAAAVSATVVAVAAVVVAAGVAAVAAVAAVERGLNSCPQPLLLACGQHLSYAWIPLLVYHLHHTGMGP